MINLEKKVGNKVGNAVDLQPLIGFIQDENLDIVDEDGMTAERFANLVNIIGNRVRFCSHNKVTSFYFKMNGRTFYVKVNNNHKGFVSVTNDEGNTGVSYTDYYPFYEDEGEGWFAGQCDLAQMINEAWYLCTAKGDNLGGKVI